LCSIRPTIRPICLVKKTRGRCAENCVGEGDFCLCGICWPEQKEPEKKRRFPSLIESFAHQLIATWSVAIIAIMNRHVFIDWDCTITQEHMYSMFVRSDRSPRTEFGKFLTTLDNNPEKIQAAENIVKRLKPLYQAWGYPEDAAIDVLQAALQQRSPLLIMPQDLIIYEDLKKFLFGSADRIAFLTRLISSIQGTGRDVTILTKGIGACVVSALRTYLPQWLETSAPISTSGGEEAKDTCQGTASDSKLLRAVIVVDYAGLVWHQGNVLRAAVPPCANKIVQMVALLNQFPYMKPLSAVTAASGAVNNKVLLVDDSASHEIKGMPSRSIKPQTTAAASSTGTTPSIDFKQVHVEVSNDSKGADNISGTVSTSTSASASAAVDVFVVDCIAGGPQRNGPGLQRAHLEEILHVASL